MIVPKLEQEQKAVPIMNSIEVLELRIKNYEWVVAELTRKYGEKDPQVDAARAKVETLQAALRVVNQTVKTLQA